MTLFFFFFTIASCCPETATAPPLISGYLSGELPVCSLQSDTTSRQDYSIQDTTVCSLLQPLPNSTSPCSWALRCQPFNPCSLLEQWLSALVGLFCCPVFFEKPESSSLPCRAMCVAEQQRADLCTRIPASRRRSHPHPLFQHTEGVSVGFSHQESGSPDSSSTRMHPKVDCTLPLSSATF